MGSLASALGSIVDLKLVHNVVSVALDRLTEADRRGRAESEEKMREQEELKSGITTVVGAALGEQECWEKTACKAGEYAASLPGKDVIFIVLDRLVPSSWIDTLDSVKSLPPTSRTATGTSAPRTQRAQRLMLRQ